MAYIIMLNIMLDILEECCFGGFILYAELLGTVCCSLDMEDLPYQTEVQYSILEELLYRFHVESPTADHRHGEI